MTPRSIGTGIQIAGGEYDTITGNRIQNQGSWGILTSDTPDNETPPPGARCQGGFQNDPLPGFCLRRSATWSTGTCSPTSGSSAT